MENNIEKFVSCFVESFGISEEMVTDDLAYQSIQAWDSVGHMVLVAALENAFDMMLDTDDIIAMSSVSVAKSILAKYRVEL